MKITFARENKLILIVAVMVSAFKFFSFPLPFDFSFSFFFQMMSLLVVYWSPLHPKQTTIKCETFLMLIQAYTLSMLRLTTLNHKV
jgi:hypothetical protein